jgi:outer membrane protein assembly factor BamB
MSRRSASSILTGICALVLVFSLAVVAFLRHEKGSAGNATTSTAPPSAPVSATAPQQPNRLLWQHTAYRDGGILIDGGYLVETGPQGITVLNIRAGRERWRFHDPGLRIVDPVRDVTARDGQVTARLRDGRGAEHVRTFDLATGQAARPAAMVRLAGTTVIGAGADARSWRVGPASCAGSDSAGSDSAGAVSAGSSTDQVFIAQSCGARSILTAVARADGSLLWRRSVSGSATIDPRDPHTVVVQDRTEQPLPGPVGRVVPPRRLLIGAAGFCRATATRVGCLSGTTGRWLWSGPLPAGARVVAGDRTLLVYRVQGKQLRAGVRQIADGAPTMPEQVLAAPPIGDSRAVRVLYTRGVLAIGDDRTYAVYADPAG